MVASELSAAGQKTPVQVFLAWMKSPQHRQLVLSPNATQIGLGHSPSGSSAVWTAILSKPQRGVHCYVGAGGNSSADPLSFYQHSVTSKFFVYAKIKNNKVFFRWPELPNVIDHEMFYSLNGGAFKSFGKVPSKNNRCRVRGLLSGWRWSLQMVVSTKAAKYVSQPVCISDMKFVQCPEFK
eukprot:TRINITY_DN581_c0_g1_i3.p1 TRINITY_DN581_c0_g1~~TRINITY_DN581_c0_g1_i3.p1  ORF type:complete len:181 (-),score=44.23 TRINITY_DN581_c0_g1_i3:64-606(-)